MDDTHRIYSVAVFVKDLIMEIIPVVEDPEKEDFFK